MRTTLSQQLSHVISACQQIRHATYVSAHTPMHTHTHISSLPQLYMVSRKTFSQTQIFQQASYVLLREILEFCK